MPTEQRYFSITLCQTHPKDLRTEPSIKVSSGADTKISFRLCKVLGHSWVEAPDATVFDDPELVAQKVISVRLAAVSRPSNRRYYTEIISENLSSIGVPLHEQDRIIESLFYRAEMATPGKPILVFIREVTLRLLDSESNLGRGDVTIALWRNGRYTDFSPYQDQVRFGWFGTEPPMCSGLPKPIPATESLIEGLKKVRVDDLEDAVRQMPCSVCMEALDHFDAAEEGTDHHQHIIVCLPCSHIYHGDCVIPWLKTNYVCPLCRKPVGKPPKPLLRLHWPMLMMSAVGMLTATIIPRLFNRG